MADLSWRSSFHLTNFLSEHSDITIFESGLDLLQTGDGTQAVPCRHYLSAEMEIM